ncbi:MAG TPA: M28 family metallopeptidase, partial [Capsulimonadaceae bacterium]|nr:M28 family metallopeptidase [Capsulimonadaceae bacterium]
KPTQITNIIATLPGDLPADLQRYIVISGHYDSRCTDVTNAIHDAPGADDDGSAVASVIEIARVMAPLHFHATIVFMCVAGEEEGLYGSKYASGQDKANGWPIEAMLNNDIIGSSTGGNGVHDSRSVRVFCEGLPPTPTNAQTALIAATGGENDSAPRELGRFIRRTAKEYVRRMNVTLVYRRDRYRRGGDQNSFLDLGYPAVRFTESNEDYRHQHQDVRVEGGVQYGDLPQFLDYGYMANVARINAASLAVLALAPDVPQKAELVVRGMTNGTPLQWVGRADPNVAGYEIVWRATTAPEWTNSRFVGNVTSCMLPDLSKDDYVFGICAVDREGHMSPAAFPQPFVPPAPPKTGR